MSKSNKQSGQIIVVLLLIVVLVLAIGLSVVGRSNNEVSTASKIENSARAFSAAEAGIEHAIALALIGNPPKVRFPSNNSDYQVSGSIYPTALVPILEQPHIGNGENSYAFAQFWFANPSNSNYNPSTINDTFTVYYGDPGLLKPPHTPDDLPALEVHVIYALVDILGNKSYKDAKFYFDSAGHARTPGTQLLTTTNVVYGCMGGSVTLLTNLSSQANLNSGTADRPFLCKADFAAPPQGIQSIPWAPSGPRSYPVLARVRVLYSIDGQNVAIGPRSGAGLLPLQTTRYSSIGTSGDTQRTVQVTRVTDVMPYLFDFALFSDNGVIKQ